MTKQYYKGLVSLLALWLLGACSADDVTDRSSDREPDEPVYIAFNLKTTPCLVLQTDGERVIHAGTCATDNTAGLQDLTALQFDLGTDPDANRDAAKCVVARWLRAPEPDQATNNYLVGLQNSENLQYVILIANAGARFQHYEGKTLGDFNAETIDFDQKTVNGENQLMIDAVEIRISGVENLTPVAVQLERLVARVDFKWQTRLTVTNATFSPLAIKLINVPDVLKFSDGLQETSVYPEKKSENYKNYPSIISGIEEGFSWYIPLNCRMDKGSGTTAWEKTAGNAPDEFCTYVELNGIYRTPNMPDQLVAYRFFIGENMVDDYNVYRNHVYDVDVTLKGVNTFDRRVTKRNFTFSQSANCFVLAPEAGNEVLFSPYESPGEDVENSGVKYKERMIEDRYSKITGVKVVWQTSAGLVAVSMQDGMIRIRANESGTEGNATVAATDVDGHILWSWHVWVTPYAHVLEGTGTKGNTYQFGGYTWMDRYLGALNTNRGNDKSHGLYYQWGRKDPFYNAAIDKSVAGTAIVAKDMGTALNIDQSVAEPNVFFYHQSSTNTWHGGTAALGTLWQPDVKTVFDPCPSGWTVPEDACWDTFNWGTNFNWDSANPYGAALTISSGTYAWFPIEGVMGNKSITVAGSNTYMWISEWNDTGRNAKMYQFYNGKSLKSTLTGSNGATVRCVKQK